MSFFRVKTATQKLLMTHQEIQRDREELATLTSQPGEGKEETPLSKRRSHLLSAIEEKEKKFALDRENEQHSLEEKITLFDLQIKTSLDSVAKKIKELSIDPEDTEELKTYLSSDGHLPYSSIARLRNHINHRVREIEYTMCCSNLLSDFCFCFFQLLWIKSGAAMLNGLPPQRVSSIGDSETNHLRVLKELKNDLDNILKLDQTRFMTNKNMRKIYLLNTPKTVLPCHPALR